MLLADMFGMFEQKPHQPPPEKAEPIQKSTDETDLLTFLDIEQQWKGLPSVDRAEMRLNQLKARLEGLIVMNREAHARSQYVSSGYRTAATLDPKYREQRDRIDKRMEETIDEQTRLTEFLNNPENASAFEAAGDMSMRGQDENPETVTSIEPLDNAIQRYQQAWKRVLRMDGDEKRSASVDRMARKLVHARSLRNYIVTTFPWRLRLPHIDDDLSACREDSRNDSIPTGQVLKKVYSCIHAYGALREDVMAVHSLNDETRFRQLKEIDGRIKIASQLKEEILDKRGTVEDFNPFE